MPSPLANMRIWACLQVDDKLSYAYAITSVIASLLNASENKVCKFGVTQVLQVPQMMLFCRYSQGV